MDIRRNLETNPKNSYPLSALKQLYLLSARKPKKQPEAIIFGSYLYRFQKYPGDIDMTENFDCEDCKNEDDVVKKFFIAFKKIVRTVIAQKEEFYSEVKCGIDQRFNLDLGVPNNGVWVPSKSLLIEITALNIKSLLSKKDYDIMILILNRKGGNTSSDYDVVKYILRNYYILRWTADEVLNNKKILPGGVVYKFTDGLHIDSLVKIDVITVINTRIIETTNVYYLAYKDGDTFIQLQGSNNIEQLKDEVEKLYYSDMFYSPFKMVKRMYAYSRSVFIEASIEIANKQITYSWKINAYKEILNKIIPFLGGDVSYLYQLKSELDTIMLLLEKFKNPIPSAISKTIDEMKIRLSKVLFLKYDTVNNMCDLLDLINKEKNNGEKIMIIDELSSMMKLAINYKTIEFLSRVSLNPPPSTVLPQHIMYPSIIRTPEDKPINPLKLVGGGYNNNYDYDDQNEQNAFRILAYRLANRQL